MSTDEIVIEDRVRSDSVETVIISNEDNDATTGKDGSCNIIDLDDESEPNEENKSDENSEPSNNNFATMKHSEESFAKLLKNNTLMSLVVKKCLEAENSAGMKRIIDKSLQTAYRNAAKSFKESHQFRKILEATLRLLDLDPGHKFSHIKVLHDSLKLRQERKKVPFITLSTDLTSSPEKRPISSNFPTRSPKKKRKKKWSYTQQIPETNNDGNNIIDLDGLNDESDDSDDIIFVAEQVNGTQVVNIDNDEPNKEHSQTENMSPSYDVPISNNYEVVDLDAAIGNKETNVDVRNDSMPISVMADIENQTSNVATDINQECFLVPLIDNELDVPESNTAEASKDNACQLDQQNEIDTNVKVIEEEIKYTKSLIDKFELREVINYSSSLSPYLLVDKWKRKIVKLYKQLCTLTGEEPVKKRTIRLKVQEGHPSGPVRRLEKILNNNLDSTGSPMFPDFVDVLTCVREANEADALNWTEMQIAKEARSLFKQCGDALRSSRQKREWRDMMCLVKQEATGDDDPADSDPTLLAKLEVNRRVAEQKEKEIFESFTDMECTRDLSSSRPKKIQAPEPFRDSSDSEVSEPSVTKTPSRVLIRFQSNVESVTNTCNEPQASSFTTFCHKTLEPLSNNEGVPNNFSYPIISCTQSLAPPSKKIEVPTNSEIPTMLTINSSKSSEPVSNTVVPANFVIPIANFLDKPGFPKIDGSLIEPLSIEVPNNLELPTINSPNTLEPDKNEIPNESPSILENNDITRPVEVKKEPAENVQIMLDALGTNFEATVFDIEDPFLIIEISSDSYSDDDL